MGHRIKMLIWELWRRNRKTIGAAIGLALCGLLLNSLLAAADETPAVRDRRLTINVLLMVASVLLVFAVFNYTEFNPQKEWTGFPRHLFTMPVPTFVLFSVPLLLGLASLELLFWFWVKVVFAPGEVSKPGWIGVLLGSFMVCYQFILWSLAGFKILRLILLGLVGVGFIGIGFLPAFAALNPSNPFSEKNLVFLLVTVAVSAFFAAWICVARQRAGGGRRRNWLVLTIDAFVDILPRRQTLFKSAAHAHFWLEWRRNGCLLPLSVGALLLAVIAPLSWKTRADPQLTLWILLWTIATPMILAVPIGKGFSKPDFWSSDLTLPSFTCVRPISTGEIIVIKLKVAALSALISWSLLLAFLSLWLPGWADLSSLTMIRVAYWMVQGHSVFPQLLMAALLLLAAILLTWKFLVGGLWIGLSGSKKLFLGSAVACSFMFFSGMICVAILANHDRPFRAWLRNDPNQLLSIITTILAAAVIAKSWLAARSWRLIQPQRTRRFLLAWLAAMLCMIILVRLLWADGTLVLALMALLDFHPLDSARLVSLPILGALLLIPLARLGLARAFL
ncbi:MAG TPA: hypothetical protein VK633_00500, partial [Verrucomicrobiae bacterium]|nr:hypothetical protein [Verrucomicrobiae bacterium]